MPHIHPLIRSTSEMPSPCSRIRCRVRERFGDATRRLHANTVSVTLYQYLHYVRKYSTKNRVHPTTSVQIPHSEKKLNGNSSSKAEMWTLLGVDARGTVYFLHDQYMTLLVSIYSRTLYVSCGL